MASGRSHPSVSRLVMMLLGACLAPLAMSGVVELSSRSDRVETEGAAAERAALLDDGGDATSGGGDGSGVGEMGGSTNVGPPGSTDETTTTTASTTTTTAPTTTVPPTTATTTAAPPPTEPPADPAPGVPAPAGEVVQLVNAARAEAATPCGPLTVDTELTAAAQLHAEDMSARDYMDHVNPEGMDPSARAAAQGHEDPVGENIAMGYPDPQAVMEGWMNSEGHRRNIENCEYNTIGVGVDSDGWYWAQVFGF